MDRIQIVNKVKQSLFAHDIILYSNPEDFTHTKI